MTPGHLGERWDVRLGCRLPRLRSPWLRIWVGALGDSRRTDGRGMRKGLRSLGSSPQSAASAPPGTAEPGAPPPAPTALQVSSRTGLGSGLQGPEHLLETGSQPHRRLRPWKPRPWKAHLVAVATPDSQTQGP